MYGITLSAEDFYWCTRCIQGCTLTSLDALCNMSPKAFNCIKSLIESWWLRRDRSCASPLTPGSRGSNAPSVNCAVHSALVCMAVHWQNTEALDCIKWLRALDDHAKIAAVSQGVFGCLKVSQGVLGCLRVSQGGLGMFQGVEDEGEWQKAKQVRWLAPYSRILSRWIFLPSRCHHRFSTQKLPL